MLRNFPRNFWAFVLCVRKNPRKIPSKFPTQFSKFPCAKSKKIHRQTSAGTQRERIAGPSKVHPPSWRGVVKKYYETVGLWTVHNLDEGGEFSKALIKGVWAVRESKRFREQGPRCLQQRGPKGPIRTKNAIAMKIVVFRKQPNTVSGSSEYGFREYGFKHRTQWAFWTSLSSMERAQWVPLSLLFVCHSELTEFFAELTEFAAELSEAQWVLFSETVLSKQYSARFLVFCYTKRR